MPSDAAAPRLTTDQPLVSYTTAKGKALRGVVIPAEQMTQEQAKAIDPFTFKHKGGRFIREKHIERPSGEDGPVLRSLRNLNAHKDWGSRVVDHPNEKTQAELDVLRNQIGKEARAAEIPFDALSIRAATTPTSALPLSVAVRRLFKVNIHFVPMG